MAEIQRKVSNFPINFLWTYPQFNKCSWHQWHVFWFRRSINFNFKFFYVVENTVIIFPPLFTQALSVLPPNICSQPATCLLSNAILMHVTLLLIVSPECRHVKLNIHKRAVKNHFIRGDHSFSLHSLLLSLPLFKYCFSARSILQSAVVYGCVSAWNQPASIHQLELVSQETQNCVCWEGGRGMFGRADGGVAHRTQDGGRREWSNERCRGREAVEGGRQQSEARPGGWHGSGASLCPRPSCPSWSLFCGQHLHPALHAKHTLQRGRLHMGLRGKEEKHSWGSAGRRGRWESSTASAYCLPLRWVYRGEMQ